MQSKLANATPAFSLRTASSEILATYERLSLKVYYGGAEQDSCSYVTIRLMPEDNDTSLTIRRRSISPGALRILLRILREMLRRPVRRCWHHLPKALRALSRKVAKIPSDYDEQALKETAAAEGSL